MNEQKWVPIREAVEFYGVSRGTLRNWDKQDKINTRRTKAGQRRFLLPTKFVEEKKRKICYCRVSSYKQKDDLQRQIKFMQQRYKDYEIWSDIGSGINWKRPKFRKILELANNGLLEELVVAHRDRLCRFAFELVQHFLEIGNAKLLVLDEQEYSSEQEITEDIMSILQIYICRQNGKRRYTKKSNDSKTNL